MSKYFPNLFESPDWYKDPKYNQTISWNSKEFKPVTFGWYKNTLYTSDITGNNPKIHSHIITKDGFIGREDFSYAGRLWLTSKFISFWKHPSKKLLPKFLKELEKKLNIKFNKDWRIEIFRNEEENLWKQILISDYIESSELSSKELKKQHILSPIEKIKRPKNSNYFKYRSKKEKPLPWKQALVKSESIKSTINESPDSFNWPINASPRNTESILWDNDKFLQFPFTYLNGNWWLGKEGSGHGRSSMFQLINVISGRIWPKFQVISFWDSPVNIKNIYGSSTTSAVFDIFKKLKQNGYDVSNWKFDGHNWLNSSKWKEKWGTMKDFFDQLDIKVTPQELEELRKRKEQAYLDHIRSPMLKKKKIVPHGFGSKNPKKKPLAWRQAMYAESYYPRLNEKLLIGEPVSIEELRDILNNKILNFEFIKLDGEVRPAKGTTMMKYIPKDQHPTGDNPSSDKVAAFYDLSKNVWRSVSNKSDEIVLIQDEDTGKLKIRVSDKKPKEEPTKPEISKVPGVSKRPIRPKVEPIIKPSIKPDIIPPTPKPEDIEVEPEEVPLDIKDPTISVDSVEDEDIIVSSEIKEPSDEFPEKELPPKEDIMFPKDKEVPKEDIMFPKDKEVPEEEKEISSEELPPKEDIMFPDDEEKEEDIL